MKKINPTRRLEKDVRAKRITNPDPVAHPEWGPGKHKSNFLVGPEDPEYEALFDAAFSAGMSYPARLIKNPQKVAVKDSSTPHQAPDPSSPCPEHPADRGRAKS
jgi:hypothetical protein